MWFWGLGRAFALRAAAAVSLTELRPSRRLPDAVHGTGGIRNDVKGKRVLGSWV
jgi:hypothetical protein